MQSPSGCAVASRQPCRCCAASGPKRMPCEPLQPPSAHCFSRSPVRSALHLTCLRADQPLSGRSSARHPAACWQPVPHSAHAQRMRTGQCSKIGDETVAHGHGCALCACGRRRTINQPVSLRRSGAASALASILYILTLRPAQAWRGRKMAGRGRPGHRLVPAVGRVRGRRRADTCHATGSPMPTSHSCARVFPHMV